VIEARLTDSSDILLDHDPGIVSWVLPSNPKQNTAVIAAEGVLQLLGSDQGMHFKLRKGIPLGSGIGGSAASAVAGAWAANVLMGCPLEKEDLVEAVLDAEDVASGGRHGDNGLPALLGGLVLVSSSNPSRYRQVALPEELHIAIILPDVEVLTRQAREMLPDQVPLRDAVHNASELAFLVDAYRCGDWETVGRCMMEDRLVEPVRARLVPCYRAVRRAALEAGAFGCALTGSGPAMFALAASEKDAARVRDAMVDASLAEGIDARGVLASANADGVAEMSERRISETAAL
jgi:homoserine kinase